jgi:hypothetical protein
MKRRDRLPCALSNLTASWSVPYCSEAVILGVSGVERRALMTCCAMYACAGSAKGFLEAAVETRRGRPPSPWKNRPSVWSSSQCLVHRRHLEAHPPVGTGRPGQSCRDRERWRAAVVGRALPPAVPAAGSVRSPRRLISLRMLGACTACGSASVGFVAAHTHRTHQGKRALHVIGPPE